MVLYLVSVKHKQIGKKWSLLYVFGWFFNPPSKLMIFTHWRSITPIWQCYCPCCCWCFLPLPWLSCCCWCSCCCWHPSSCCWCPYYCWLNCFYWRPCCGFFAVACIQDVHGITNIPCCCFGVPLLLASMLLWHTLLLLLVYRTPSKMLLTLWLFLLLLAS